MNKRDFLRKNWPALSLITLWVLFWLTVYAWTYTDSFAEMMK